MAIEIERKFLLRSTDWRACAMGSSHLRQAYLAQDGGLSTRVRLVDATAATLTIKSRKAGLKRLEFEFPIPLADAEALLAFRQGTIIEKMRHSVHWHGRRWEIDVFEGENAGLVIAEIELRSEHDRFDLPPWLGAEITGEERYYNSRLVQQPFCMWAAETRPGAEPAN